MEKMLLVPDLHGRRYLLESAKQYALKYPNRKIIFLGDYLDPYSYEWSYDPELESNVEDKSQSDAFALFEEVLDFSEVHRDTVILLLGNHDCHYIGISEDSCRMDFHRKNDIYSLFVSHKDLFRFAYKVNNVLFTHAGCTSGWLEQAEISEDVNTIEQSLNDNIIFTDKYLIHSDNGSLLDHRGDIGYRRGGYYTWGSCIWADLSETYKKPAFDGKLIQIFGHSQLETTGSIFHKKNIYCIDSRSTFECEFKEKEFSNLTKYEQN